MDKCSSQIMRRCFFARFGAERILHVDLGRDELRSSSASFRCCGDRPPAKSPSLKLTAVDMNETLHRCHTYAARHIIREPMNVRMGTLTRRLVVERHAGGPPAPATDPRPPARARAQCSCPVFGTCSARRDVVLFQNKAARRC